MYMEAPCTKVYSIATCHSPFFRRPGKLTDILHDIAITQTGKQEKVFSGLAKKE